MFAAERGMQSKKADILQFRNVCSSDNGVNNLKKFDALKMKLLDMVMLWLRG
jgi:hypothetical protein